MCFELGVMLFTNMPSLAGLVSKFKLTAKINGLIFDFY